MTRIALHGASGRMGRAIAAVVADAEDLAIAAEYDEARPADAVEADVVIDFTTPGATARIATLCAESATPLVSGTTGLDAAAEAALDRLAERAAVVHAPNMSAGVTLLFHLAEIAASGLEGFDAEIVEMHHRHKVDAPSGTAVRLAEHVARARSLGADALRFERSGSIGPRPADEIGVMSLRGGAVVGDHTLHLVGEGERLELTHRAMDRSIFARGAIRAARWVLGRAPGRYGMADVLGLTSRAPA